MVNIENILFTTDFSEDSAHALPYARALAEKFNTKLYIVHVIHNPISSIYGQPHGDYLAMEANARTKTREMMGKYDNVLRDFPNHELVIKEGDIVEKILETIDEKRIGTAVMGAHGGGILRHFLIGGTTRKVLTSVSCPVYVIRHPSRPAAGS